MIVVFFLHSLSTTIVAPQISNEQSQWMQINIAVVVVAGIAVVVAGPNVRSIVYYSFLRTRTIDEFLNIF